MRTTLTSGTLIESVATLAAAVLMTVAGLASFHDDPATTAVVTVSAPTRVPDAVGQNETSRDVAMPHVDISRG